MSDGIICRRDAQLTKILPPVRALPAVSRGRPWIQGGSLTAVIGRGH